jgi:hypothetical protein
MGEAAFNRLPVVEAICARLAEGTPLTVICRDADMPSVMTVWRWQDEDEAIALAIARAREVGGDAIADAALAIADERAEDPASRRVMVETRLKLLAKWHPKRYGDKLGIGQADGLEPAQVAFTPWPLPAHGLEQPK